VTVGVISLSQFLPARPCPAVFGCFSLSQTEKKKFRELHFPEYILVSPDAAIA
jgi:hypothetical protein